MTNAAGVIVGLVLAAILFPLIAPWIQRLAMKNEPPLGGTLRRAWTSARNAAGWALGFLGASVGFILLGVGLALCVPGVVVCVVGGLLYIGPRAMWRRAINGAASQPYSAQAALEHVKAMADYVAWHKADESASHVGRWTH